MFVMELLRKYDQQGAKPMLFRLDVSAGDVNLTGYLLLSFARCLACSCGLACQSLLGRGHFRREILADRPVIDVVICKPLTNEMCLEHFAQVGIVRLVVVLGSSNVTEICGKDCW